MCVSVEMVMKHLRNPTKLADFFLSNADVWKLFLTKSASDVEFKKSLVESKTYFTFFDRSEFTKDSANSS